MRNFLLLVGWLFVTTFTNSFAIETATLLQNTSHSYLPKESNSRLFFSYTSSISRFYHSPKPYDTYTNNSFGRFEIEGSIFKKHDSIFAENKYYSNDYFFNQKDVLSKSPLDTVFLPQTEESRKEQIIQLLFYSPVPLLRYALLNQEELTLESTKHLAKLEVEINNSNVTLFINKDKFLVDSLHIIYYDSYYGDIKNVINYTHSIEGTLHYPSTVIHKKMNGKITDTLRTSFLRMTTSSQNNDPIRPKDFTYSTVPKSSPILDVTKLTPTITALQFRNERIQSFLIEFSTFLVVVEAPLTSEIGEKILEFTKKTFPKKPILYVCYSHHHPHYTGALRPFVHNGAIIVTKTENKDYLESLLANSHTLKPDSLEFSKKIPAFITYDSTFTITDAIDSLQLFHLGIQSNHTYDYTLFYTAKEKVLLVGDLVWISTDSIVKKAGKGQKAVFDFLNEKAIPVETIYQAWPVMSPKYKTIIPFSELKASVEMK